MATQPNAEFIALQGALAGEYSLDREIGRGGMGVVYLAREVRLARPVAIKVLPPTLAAHPELRAAFLREAQTAAGLTHPNIVSVYSVGERDGFVYMAMAFVEGSTLGERIRSRGPLLPGQAARVLREVAWALAYAHGAGIVHRDVSAENILLERGSERAIVTDFGIASAMQASALDADGRVMGNAHYVSPEQVAGEPLDARSDLYSLGIVGFYALTGRLPFDGETSGEVVAKHLNMPAPAIISVAPSVPPRLAAAVERCLHKLPLRRYRNAESFAEAIDLAFEHAKEIPAPLRSWINQGERELPARFALLGIGVMGGVTVVASGLSFGWSLLSLGVMGALSYVPWTHRLRRVLREGFLPDDLSAALREHQLVRAEELEYERRLASPWVPRVLRVAFGASLATAVFAETLSIKTQAFVLTHWKVMRDLTTTRFGPDDFTFAYDVAFLVSLGVLAVATVGLAGDFVRFRLAARTAAASIAVWRSRWGRRLAKLASLGLKPVARKGIGMPMLTEIALGRATDHLFEALPKVSRRQLAALPDTVRRLESDAGKLRLSITAFDDQLAVFERGDDALHDGDRGTIAEQLRTARSLAAQRLALTVAALENIRLDLLRLQMGSAGLESVTASLDAARQIGEQIAGSVEAQREVELLLAERFVRPPPLPSAEDEPDEADDDTPVGGVPTARG
jgi:serine/threonine protein kinase